MTGTVAWRASVSMVSWAYTRAAIPSTQRERFRATSATASRVPRPISWPERYTARPPSWTIPTSKVTRVRSEGFSKISATVRPASGVPRRPTFHRCLRSAASANIWSAVSRVRSADPRK